MFVLRNPQMATRKAKLLLRQLLGHSEAWLDFSDSQRSTYTSLWAPSQRSGARWTIWPGQAKGPGPGKWLRDQAPGPGAEALLWVPVVATQHRS